MARFQGTLLTPTAKRQRPHWHVWLQVWIPIGAALISAIWLGQQENQRRKFEMVREALDLSSSIDRISRLKLLRSARLVDHALIDSLLVGARRESGTTLSYAATFEARQFEPFAQPTGDFKIDPGGWFDDDHVHGHFCIRLIGPSTMKLTLPKMECRGRRVVAEAWVRSQGILERNSKDPLASGKFHISWHVPGASDWVYSSDGDFFSEPGLTPTLVVNERWRLLRFVTPLLPDSIDGINIYAGIQGTTGEVWFDDVTVLVY